jgi:hypothetical protein
MNSANPDRPPIQVSNRVPADIYDVICAMATKKNTSKNRIINEVLKDWVHMLRMTGQIEC